MSQRTKAFRNILIVIAFPTLGFLLASLLSKRYTAQVSLLIDQTISAPRQESFAAVEDLTGFARGRSVATQIDILTGTEVLNAALTSVINSEQALLRTDEDRNQSYTELVRRLRVDSTRESDVVTVRVTQGSPELAAAFANEIGKAYIEYSNNLSKQFAARGTALIDSQFNDIRVRLADLDARITAQKKRTKIVDAESSGPLIARVYTEAKVTTDNVRAQYEGALKELESAKRQLAVTPIFVLQSDSRQYNPEYQATISSLAQLQAQLADLEQTYLPQNPEIGRLKAKIASLSSHMRMLEKMLDMQSTRALNPIYSQLKTNVNQLESRVNGLAGQLEETKKTEVQREQALKDAPAQLAALQSLTREKMVLEATYQQILQKRSAIEIAGGRKSNAEIVSYAVVPREPSFPDARIFVLFGAVMGFVVLIFFNMPNRVLGEPREEATNELPGAPTLDSGNPSPTMALDEGPPPQMSSRNE